ncbi:MAG: biotin/lipoyl-containing protein [Thermoplasmata archaeon]
MFLKYEHKNHVYNVEVEKEDGNYYITYDDKTYTVTATEVNVGHLKIELGDRTIKSVISEGDDSKYVFLNGDVFEVTPIALTGVKRKKGDEEEGDLKSPISGKVVKVEVQDGQEVEKGDVLMVIEAMKMEYLIKAPYDGVVKKINFNEDEQIDIGEKTVEIEKDVEEE